MKAFTSHYVPIKSRNSISLLSQLVTFTSHYVPIKSEWIAEFNSLNIYLHPIMFLLNLLQNPQWTDERLFTSHYVPIKSVC